MKIKLFFKSRCLLITALILSAIVIIALFLFYKECNNVKVRRINVEFEASKHSVQDYSVCILSNNSRKERSGYIIESGCLASLDMIPDSNMCFLDKKEKNYNIDSVWATASINISSTVSARYVFNILNGKLPKPKLDSCTVVFIDPLETVWNTELLDYVTTSKTKHFFRGNPNLINTAYAYYSCNTYGKPNFLSQRNISISCLVLHISSVIKKGKINIDFLGPMNIMNISPEPDLRTETGVKYYSDDKIKEIENKGVFIYAESIIYKDLQEVRNYILISLIGIFSSIIISLFIMLIRGKKE